MKTNYGPIGPPCNALNATVATSSAEAFEYVANVCCPPCQLTAELLKRIRLTTITCCNPVKVYVEHCRQNSSLVSSLFSKHFSGASRSIIFFNMDFYGFTARITMPETNELRHRNVLA